MTFISASVAFSITLDFRSLVICSAICFAPGSVFSFTDEGFGSITFLLIASTAKTDPNKSNIERVYNDFIFY